MLSRKKLGYTSCFPRHNYIMMSLLVWKSHQIKSSLYLHKSYVSRSTLTILYPLDTLYLQKIICTDLLQDTNHYKCEVYHSFRNTSSSTLQKLTIFLQQKPWDVLMWTTSVITQILEKNCSIKALNFEGKMFNWVFYRLKYYLRKLFL